MANSKYDSLFYGIFFFIQGVIITFIVMLSVFNYKFVPVMQKKDHEIELLMERLMGGNKSKEHSHSGNSNNRKIYEVKPGVVITIW